MRQEILEIQQYNMSESVDYKDIKLEYKQILQKERIHLIVIVNLKEHQTGD